MTTILYLANIRLPTEKAHGLQIMQNAEAFARALNETAGGSQARVRLWIARRQIDPALRSIDDVWAHYGVDRVFPIRRLPCLDALRLAPDREDPFARAMFLLQLITFTIAACVGVVFARRGAVVYTRDEWIAAALSLFLHPRDLAYECHSLRAGRVGGWVQRRALRGAGVTFATTARLAADLRAWGAASVHTAHDGYRAERFANLPTRDEARRALGWPPGLFIVGYVGRLHTMKMDKGAGLLIEAAASLGDPRVAVALVGGPDDAAHDLAAAWARLGGAPDRVFVTGQVAPDRVTSYLAAFDACAMPFPWTTHFAYYASPIKLFEYMAARRPVIATDLPSTAEIVADGDSALLVPPGDVEAFAAAIRRLLDDSALGERLAARAAVIAVGYTWEARARMIVRRIPHPPAPSPLPGEGSREGEKESSRTAAFAPLPDGDGRRDEGSPPAGSEGEGGEP